MPKILVVDDNLTMGILLTRVVERLGYETLKACDGFEALRIVRDEHPDTVLLDIMMPGMTGLEVLETMKQDPASKDIPVILVTAKGEDEDVIRGLECGAHDYVTKPFKIEILAARTRAAVRLRQNQQEIQEANRKALHEVEARHNVEQELAQAQRLEAVGHLATGIAHEINSPSQFIADNLRFLQDTFGDVDQAFGVLDRLVEAARTGRATPELANESEAIVADLDTDYIRTEGPKAIRESLDGILRIADIIGAMRDFSNPGQVGRASMDLARCIQSTLTVTHSKWSPVADLVAEFDPTLPQVYCYVADFNQVVLQLVVNAIHAMEDAGYPQNGKKGVLTVRSCRDDDWAEIHISDNGVGIPADIQDKVYNPFFTTRDTGDGRGQGLTLARSIVVDKHGGTIAFDSREGEGTTFIVRIPIADQDAAVSAANELVNAAG